MTEITTYAPGTPCWVDYNSPDIDKSVGFYGDLLGWDFDLGENPEETGGYRVIRHGGKRVAGMMPAMQEGSPAAWQTYVAVDNADETAEKVKAAGGNVVAEPMDVMELGRMAVFTDPEGAYFAIWQGNQMPGAEVANQPGAWSWNELNTRDAGSAKSFYSQVFDWSFSDMEIGGGTYTTFKPPSRGEEDESAGGLLDMQTMGVPDHVPPHWLSYFTVDSLDESLEQAKGAGANVNAGPMVFPQGKLAVLVDPLGGAFGLWEVTA